MSNNKQYEVTIKTKEQDFIEILDEAGVENATLCYSVNDVTDPDEVFDELCDRYTSDSDISRNELRTMISALTLNVFENLALDDAGFVVADTDYYLMRGINRKFVFTAKSLAQIIKCDAENLKEYDIIIDGVDISSISLSDYKEQLGVKDWAECSKETADALLEAHRAKHGA